MRQISTRRAPSSTALDRLTEGRGLPIYRVARALMREPEESHCGQRDQEAPKEDAQAQAAQASQAAATQEVDRPARTGFTRSDGPPSDRCRSRPPRAERRVRERLFCIWGTGFPLGVRFDERRTPVSISRMCGGAASKTCCEKRFIDRNSDSHLIVFFNEFS